MRILGFALVVVAGLSFAGGGASGQEARHATMFKNPQCGCCENYASYLREHGFAVTVKPTHDLSLTKRTFGVPERFDGCHTMVVDGYVVEGHVPVATLNRLLTERPKIRGISLPGMPEGSPGMSGAKISPFKIYEIDARKLEIYAVE